MPTVELGKLSRRQDGEPTWNFHHDTVPLDIPMELWQKTCDRVMATVEQFSKRRTDVAYQRARASVLGTYPCTIFFVVFLLSSVHSSKPFGGEDGLFLWMAWMITLLTTALLSGISWLIIHFYINPQYLQLENGWRSLVDELQQEYEPYGIQVQVKRIPAVLPFLVKILPDGQISCGIILHSENPDDSVVDESESEVFPTRLSSRGVPAGTWASTVEECQVLHENQVERIKSRLQCTVTYLKWSLAFNAVCFTALPFLAWGLDMRSTSDMRYFGWALMAVVMVETLGERLIQCCCCSPNLLYKVCDHEWEELATRTKPVYAQYGVQVRPQIRSPMLGQALKTAISTIFGVDITGRIVGLSFWEEDNTLVTIEYGKVVVVDNEQGQDVEKTPLVEPPQII